MATGTDDFAPAVFLEYDRDVEAFPPPPPSNEESMESLNEEEAKTLENEILDMKRSLKEVAVQLDTAKQEEKFLEADKLKRTWEEFQSVIPNMEKRLKEGVERDKKIKSQKLFQKLFQNNDELDGTHTRKKSRETVKEKINAIVEDHKEDLIGSMEYFKILDNLGKDGATEITVVMEYNLEDILPDIRPHFESIKSVQNELDSLDAETSQMLRDLWQFLESENSPSVIQSMFHYTTVPNVQLQFTQLSNLYNKGFCLCYRGVKNRLNSHASYAPIKDSYFLCNFERLAVKRDTKLGLGSGIKMHSQEEEQVRLIVPFGINCDGERILVQTLFDLTTSGSWIIPENSVYCRVVTDCYTYIRTTTISHIPIIGDDINLFYNFGSILDKDDSLISTSTIVDQTNVDLREILSSPQAKAFRRVVCSIWNNRPQHHLFQSYLRSRGFDVSISKQNKYGGSWTASQYGYKVVLKWNVWNTVPKNDWLQSLWSELKAYKK